VPSQLLRYSGEQLGIETDNIEEYFNRQATRTEHKQEIEDLLWVPSTSSGHHLRDVFIRERVPQIPAHA
jgi:hypothetical protein